MNKKIKKKYNSYGNKMPSIFKKSPSDPGTLCESHRKVLHRCRMMLIKDLEVTDILDYMSQEDGFKSDVRDTILSYPERERRVATLLDKLETRGDRVFLLFMEALREHYKHLHYVLEETLRNADDKDSRDREYRLSISGESVRKVIKNSLKRRTQYMEGFESIDDLDTESMDDGEETYIDCYSIPFRGRLQKEQWIRQAHGNHGNGYNNKIRTHTGVASSIEGIDDNEETTYMAVVLKDLLFKRIELSEIPDDVKHPPAYCSVFVVDNENKYGLIKKGRKVELDGSTNFIDGVEPSEVGFMEEIRNKDPILQGHVSQEVPDYTAPPPPSSSSEKLSTVTMTTAADEDSGPPPPLPPKPGNLPSLGFRPISMQPKIIEKGNSSKDELQSNTLVQEPELPPKPKEQQLQEEEFVTPPPRSTSLTQSLSQIKEHIKFERKPLPTNSGSKFLITKAKFEKSGSVSPPVSSNSSDKSPTPGASPPVPPRKYMENGEILINGLSGTGVINGGLSGMGALSGVTTVPPLSPPSHRNTHITQLDIKVNEPEHHKLEIVKVNNDLEDSNVSSDDLDLNQEVKVESEEEFDPYSMGVDSIFQVRRRAVDEHGVVVVEANGDVAPVCKDGSQSSSTTETVKGSTATLSKEQVVASSDEEDEDYDVDQQIPVQEEDYEAVGGYSDNIPEAGTGDKESSPEPGNADKESSPEHDDRSNSARRINRSRDSTPYDSEDAAKRDSRDASTLDSSFKASADSLNSNTTPGSQGARSITTDSGIDGGAAAAQTPPRMIPQRTTSQKSGQISSRPLPKDPPLPTAVNSNTLSDVQVLANDGSSDTDSYYEDIDVLDKDRIPRIDTSERTSVSYLDPKTYFKAIERMAQQGIYKDSTLKRIAIVEEWEASGRALIHRDELVVADVLEAYSQPKAEDTQCDSPTTEVVEEGAVGLDPKNSDEERVEETTSTCDISTNSVNGLDNKDVYRDYRFTKLVYDKIGRAFYMPSEYIKTHGDPMGEPWFYPIDISSHQATLFLCAQRQQGCFLLYKPSKTKSNILYNLSLCRGYDEVVHYHIVKNIHGDVMIEGHDHSFLNVKDLVQYFQRNKSQLATKLRRPLREASLPITPGYHYDLKWEISRSHLNLSGKIIGRGNYGVVCSGMYHNNIPVAVKVLQKSDASIQEEDDFIDEAKCLMGLNHDHIVRFVGLSCTAKPFFLVYEYLPKGNLRECLQNSVVPSDNIEQLFDLCIQTTSAMYYLESQRFVLHRDLASRNFLVAEDLCVKLADFGRARLVNDDNFQASKTEKIPIKWAAPEVLLDSCYSTKSDVWALGVVFWEVLSGGQKPYSGLTGDQTAVYVTEGGRLDKPPKCPMDLYNMMCSCWQDNPDDRPSFAHLYDKLKSKSSIYYSSPIRAEPALPKVKKKDNHHHHIQSPTTPGHKTQQTSNLNFASINKTKVKRSLSQTSKKVRHTVMIETTRSPMENSSSKDFLNHQSNGTKSKVRPMSGGSDRLLTSGSETSLNTVNSTLNPADLDELTRGGKIRKSLRKIISMRQKRKSSASKLDGVKEYTPTHSMYGADH